MGKDEIVIILVIAGFLIGHLLGWLLTKGLNK
jgi:hypothetical protein